MYWIYLITGIWYNITHACLSNLYYSYKGQDIKSHLSIIHSSLITVSSILYLNNIIEIECVLANLYFLSSYMLYDTYYNYMIWNKKELIIKSIHHIIAFIGIYVIQSDIYKTIVIKLFLTEIINIPLELRFIAIRYNYNKYYIRTILSCIIYILFLNTRIINPFNDYCEICKTGHWIAFIDFTGVYVLWIYWFVLINKKVIKDIKKVIVEFRECKTYLF